jgi:hypothetical protein
MFKLAIAVYLAGVGIGLTVMRDRWPARIATALAWPLGVVAFVVVAVVLVAAAVYLWPIPILATAGLIIAIWYLV